MQQSCKAAKPKNTGKKNATTAETQADCEAEALHVYRLERKYSLTPEEAMEPSELPMLALSYKDSLKKNLVFPVHGQPKLDGFRCLATNKGGIITLTSRTGIDFDLPHIKAELQSVMPEGSVYDGELYQHSKSFQSIASAIKKPGPGTIGIRHHIYDIPEYKGKKDKPWSERFLDLKEVEVMVKNSKHLDVVETFTVNNEEEVGILLGEMMAKGYEGLMLRTFTGLYVYDYRSSDLLKCKDFDDAEFLIIGVKPGIGKYSNCGIFQCETETSEITFWVMPKGTMKEREANLTNASSIIGGWMKVKFLGRTEDGKPKVAVGIGIRPGFDMPRK